MKSVLRFFVRNHLVAVLFTLMIFVLGINALWGIKRDNYPNVDYAEMTITTVYPGASPEDVEINVTHKIEKELRSVTGLKDFVSVSMENSSNIMILIDPDASDQEKIKMKVREAVNRVVDLPAEVNEAPFVEESNNAQIPIIEVGITSQTASYRELHDYARIFEKSCAAWMRSLVSANTATACARSASRCFRTKFASTRHRWGRSLRPSRSVISARPPENSNHSPPSATSSPWLSSRIRWKWGT